MLEYIAFGKIKNNGDFMVSIHRVPVYLYLIITHFHLSGIISFLMDMRDSWSVSRKIIELPIKNRKILLTFA